MNLRYPKTQPLHRALIDRLNIHTDGLPTTQWEWGRIASEFTDEKNFDFAQGAYSSVDRLVEAAMDDPRGLGKFKTIVNSNVDRLVPAPNPDTPTTVDRVIVKDTAGSVS